MKIVNLITVARYAPLKKGFDLIESISEELQKKINFKWTFVGRGTEKILDLNFVKKNLNNFNTHNEINQNDEFYFPNRKLIEIYKNQDIYLNLAKIESFGVTIIEAMAAKLPVITFNTKGGNELIINNENGYIVDQGNIKDYVEKIIFTFNNKNALKYKEFNSEYLKQFCLEIVSKKTLDEYKKLLIK